MKQRSSVALWPIFEPLLQRQIKRKPGAGRLRVDVEKVFEAVIWILYTGAPWRSIPQGLYPSYQTCHRYFQAWAKAGLLKKLIRKVRQRKGSSKTKQMHFVDGSFSPAKKGGAYVGKTKKGKGTKVMAIVDEKSKPVSILIASASVHEVRLAELLLKEKFSAEKPRRLTGDRAYDSDALDQRLKGRQVELNAPHRKGRRKKATQDGRKLRAYRRRWKVERFFAWLFNFRRCVVRYEQQAENFKAFLLLASAIILTR